MLPDRNPIKTTHKICAWTRAMISTKSGRLPKNSSSQRHIPVRGEEAQKIKRKARAKARRWVVERTHSWMNRFRGILIRWSKKPENYIAMLHMAFAFIIYGRMELFG